MAIAYRKLANFDSWDHENGVPKPVTPPESDLDVFSRIRAVIPEAANWFATRTIPKQLTLSTVMLNAEERAVDQKADAELQRIKRADFESQMKLSAMEGKVKLLTNEGKPICVVMLEAIWKAGTRKDPKTGKWNTEPLTSYYRGDQFTPIPADMPDALTNWAEKKSGLLQEARLFYNRDSRYTSGKNIFWHRDYANKKWIIDPEKIVELKLLLK